MSKSIDELVAALPPTRHGTLCWAAERLSQRGRDFMAAVVAREATGVKLNRPAIITTLQKEFGVTVGQEALKRHMAGRCSCGK